MVTHGDKSNGKTLKKADYTLDGMDDGEAADDVYSRANPTRPGFTKTDQKDMWRMGKVQELKVRSFHDSSQLPNRRVHSRMERPKKTMDVPHRKRASNLITAPPLT